MIDWYVDPDASGADDGTSWTDAWDKLSDALSAIPDPPTDDITIHCRASSNTPDGFFLPGSYSWYNSGTYTVTIKCDFADCHQGRSDIGYRLEKSGLASAQLSIYSVAFNLIIDGLSFIGDTGATSGEVLSISMEERDLTIKNCFFYGGYDQCYILPTLSNSYLYNNFFLDAADYGISGDNSSNYQAGYEAAIYNCYLASCNINLNWDDGAGTKINLYVKNCYFGDAQSGNDYNPLQIPDVADKIATGDTSGEAGLQNIVHAVGSGTYITQLTPAINLRIASDSSGLYQAGSDLSSDVILAFSVDFAGVTRPASWSIGPDEYQAVTPGPNQQQALLRQSRNAMQAAINENPIGIEMLKLAKKDNGFGEMIDDPYGSTGTERIRVRIAHEKKGPFGDDVTTQGLSTGLSRFIISTWKNILHEGAIFSAIGKRWKIGPVDPLIKFGGIIGYQAPLLEADV